MTSQAGHPWHLGTFLMCRPFRNVPKCLRAERGVRIAYKTTLKCRQVGTVFLAKR